MKRILVVLSLVGFVGSSALAGECASSKSTACASKGTACSSKTASTCPVSKAQASAKGSAGSIKEHARASKAFVLVAAR